MRLDWEKFDYKTANDALSRSFCLYVFHHPDDERPYYIGKAKYFGKNQPDGRRDNARYSGGYEHLVVGMLRGGFNLYVASIGKKAFKFATDYEQALIEQWNPIRDQDRRKYTIRSVETTMPWIRG